MSLNDCRRGGVQRRWCRNRQPTELQPSVSLRWFFYRGKHFLLYIIQPFTGFGLTVLLNREKIVVVIYVNRGLRPSLFRGRSCAGARSDTQQPASARLSGYVGIAPHRVYFDCTFRNF
jgi:hypothetical protein